MKNNAFWVLIFFLFFVNARFSEGYHCLFVDFLDLLVFKIEPVV